MSFADKTIECRECGNQFTFTAGEQEFYAQKGFTNEPTRCPSCRQARKAAGGGGGRSSYGDGGGGYRSDRGGGGGSREGYPATCDSCGRQTTVPFQPTQGRPVYCSDCFRAQRGGGGGGGRGGYR
jgi:CxxC-x17-CxxC domain-containing protein